MSGRTTSPEGDRRAEELQQWKRRCSIALASLMPTLTDSEVERVVDALAAHSSYLEPVEAASIIADWNPGEHLPKA